MDCGQKHLDFEESETKGLPMDEGQEPIEWEHENGTARSLRLRLTKLNVVRTKVFSHLQAHWVH